MAQGTINYLDKTVGGGDPTGKWKTADANEVKSIVNANSADAESRLTEIETPSLRTVDTASPTAILVTDGTILFDTASTAIAIDLPAANLGTHKIPFKDIGCNSASNNITINRVGADTIVDSSTGQTSVIIALNGTSGYFLSNGTDTWYLFI